MISTLQMNDAISYPYNRTLSLRTAGDDTATLLHRISLARKGILGSSEATRAKHRLVEAHLPLITSLAKQYTAKNRSFHMLEVADLIQEGSIALLQALEQNSITTVASFRAYSIAIIRTSFARTHGGDDPMCLPHSSYYRAKQQGTLHHFSHFVSSLNAPLYENDGEADTLVDRLPAPPLLFSSQHVSSTSCCPKFLLSLGIQHNESKTALVEKLLATLPPRQEQVLRLRYGLDETNGCAYTQDEVADLLGISRSAVNDAERRALQNLRTRKLSFGQRSTRSLALKGNKNACHRTEAGLQQIERQRREREERLCVVYQQLQEHGIRISIGALSRAAHTDNRTVAAFLHMHRSEEQPLQRSTSIEERLIHAYTHLESTREKLTIKLLSKLAHTDSTVARAFLRSRGIQVQRGRPKKSKQDVGVGETLSDSLVAEAS